MQIVVPKETHPHETRVAMVPASVKKLVPLGATIAIEAGLGDHLNLPDSTFEEAGATIVKDRKELLGSGDIVLRVRKPESDELSSLKKNAIHISYLDPFQDKVTTGALKEAGITSLCMEMVPRSTLAQKMDALSSQASLAGYVAVMEAAHLLDRIFPMMMTPAGTITPASVFILGAGVAGLQAIATAKRLGARVTAFDIRPSSQTEVESLGAKFLKIDLGETGQTKDGYAKELTPEQVQKQLEGQTKQCIASDVIITTAQLFGRKAPVLIKKEVIEQMKPGSVIVDMAVESGGNVEGSEVGKVVDINGVKIIGYANLPGRVAFHASQMYASNLTNMITHFWDSEVKTFKLDLEDEILKGCLITHNGEIVNERIIALG